LPTLTLGIGSVRTFRGLSRTISATSALVSKGFNIQTAFDQPQQVRHGFGNTTVAARRPC
jgi:hypothetical protein